MHVFSKGSKLAKQNTAYAMKEYHLSSTTCSWPAKWTLLVQLLAARP